MTADQIRPLIWDTNNYFAFTHGGDLTYWAQENKPDGEDELTWWYVDDGGPFFYSFLNSILSVSAGNSLTDLPTGFVSSIFSFFDVNFGSTLTGYFLKI